MALRKEYCSVGDTCVLCICLAASLSGLAQQTCPPLKKPGPSAANTIQVPDKPTGRDEWFLSGRRYPAMSRRTRAALVVRETAASKLRDAFAEDQVETPHMSALHLEDCGGVPVFFSSSPTCSPLTDFQTSLSIGSSVAWLENGSTVLLVGITRTQVPWTQPTWTELGPRPHLRSIWGSILVAGVKRERRYPTAG